MNAARSGKALVICTISDCPLAGGEECTAFEREQTFNKMIEIALRRPMNDRELINAALEARFFIFSLFGLQRRGGAAVLTASTRAAISKASVSHS